MKLLVVSNMYPTAEQPVGGIFVHEQVKALRQAGIDARVASGKPLWLSGRHPRSTARRVRAEMASRRQPFGWDIHDGVPVARFNYFAGAFAKPSLYPWLYRNSLQACLPALASDFPYDIVHTHTAFLDGRAGAAAARFRSVPMVLTEHTGPFALVTEDRRFRRHTLAGMRSADLLIAVSRALRDEIARRLPEMDRSRILVVPNGVDTEFFDPGKAPGEDTVLSPLERWRRSLDIAKTGLILASFIVGLRESLREIGDQPVTGAVLADCVEAAVVAGIGEGPYHKALIEAGLPVKQAAGEEAADGDDDAAVQGKALTVLWVGHLVGVKRVDRLLDAFAAASRKVPNLRLRLVGGGELEAALRRQAAELGISGRVAFLPHADRTGVRREMAKADCLVIASEAETFGVVGIEAMAMGLPVLATDCGGPADYVTTPSVGELVDNTTEGLAAGLERIAARVEQTDRDLVRRHAMSFDFKRVAELLHEQYRKLLDGAAAPAHGE